MKQKALLSENNILMKRILVNIYLVDRKPNRHYPKKKQDEIF